MFEAPTSVLTRNSTTLTIAIDAMGGDKAPHMVIEGAHLARVRNPAVHFIFYGDESRLKPIIAQYPDLVPVSEIRHTPDIIGGEIKASVALRQGKNSSMRLAIDAVNAGEAACIVSAGNTGALMAMAMFAFRTLPGIDRPAIASVVPTVRGETVMLDMGANVDCTANNYVQFAVMGAIFARTALGILNPTIGLLNIGSEEMKGHPELQEANTLLKNMALPGTYIGFIEGNDIGSGKVDVVVTDGFSGNVALKTLEGTAKLMAHFVRKTFTYSLFAKIGYVFARGAFRVLKERIDPRKYNGAMFLGLKGVCIKSHGGTDAVGFANAIGVALDLVRQGFNDSIKHELAKHAEVAQPAAIEKPANTPEAE